MSNYRAKQGGPAVQAEQFSQAMAASLVEWVNLSGDQRRKREEAGDAPKVPAGVTASDQGGFFLDTGAESERLTIGNFVVQYGDGRRSQLPAATFAELYQIDEAADERSRRVQAALANPPKPGKATATKPEGAAALK